jgi:clan AA aspartic protease
MPRGPSQASCWNLNAHCPILQAIALHGELLMGATHVTVAVSNPADPSRRWEGLFLVDTGAIDCYVPAKYLHSIGLTSDGKRTYALADGTEMALDIAVARVEFMGEVVGATVIFGADDAEPLLGVTALESVGIEVDPQNQRLKRLPAVRLKRVQAD